MLSIATLLLISFVILTLQAKNSPIYSYSYYASFKRPIPSMVSAIQSKGSNFTTQSATRKGSAMPIPAMIMPITNGILIR